MLVLSRKPDESIMIGDDIQVSVVDVRGDKVRLGITAPKSVPVHRFEIYMKVLEDRRKKNFLDVPGQQVAFNEALKGDPK